MLSRATRSGACFPGKRSSQPKILKKMKTKWHLVYTWILARTSLGFAVSTSDRQAERVRLSHDRANESGKAKAVDNFRGVTFDNWLRLFMQVRSSLYENCTWAY